MTPLFLSQARLRSTLPTAALTPLLIDGQRLTPHAGKALVWSLFADGPDRRRDFLWRWDGGRPGKLGGEMLILSARPPVDPHNLFDLETKDFAPVLASGDRLAFRLRANPVVRQRQKEGERSTKHDVVMSGLRKLPEEKRAELREGLIAESGQAWMRRQLEKAGGELVYSGLRIDGYEQHRVPHGRDGAIRFSSLDFDGLLTVGDPDRFLEALAAGFGAAKAYGFGLMLIKRA
jgi:CRISPR system Cascade subunit CasE